MCGGFNSLFKTQIVAGNRKENSNYPHLRTATLRLIETASGGFNRTITQIIIRKANKCATIRMINDCCLNIMLIQFSCQILTSKGYIVALCGFIVAGINEVF